MNPEIDTKVVMLKTLLVLEVFLDTEDEMIEKEKSAGNFIQGKR